MENRILITKLHDKIMAYHYLEDRIQRVLVKNENTEYILGTIFIGKVKKIIPGIRAAFISDGNQIEYFMQLPTEEQDILMVNRKYDGKLKVDDEIVVQITKQAVKLKQPIVDTQLSIHGNYCIVETGKKGLQISSKLSKRQHLLMEQCLQSDEVISSALFKIIVRTNAGFVTPEEVLKDVKITIGTMEQICKVYNSRTCYSTLYLPEDSLLSRLCEIPMNEYEEIITDLESYYALVKEKITKPVRLYQDTSYPFSKCYSLETRTNELLAQKVWLKSGGFLVIEQGETLTAIDVNTGKNDRKTDIIFATNMEAAKEICIQLRARNISGMILIDFINMKDADSRQKLIQFMKEELRKDYVKASYIDITGLGLMELTREKKQMSLREELKAWN